MPATDVIYLDAHATTPLDPAVAAEMDRVRRTAWGNPASQHVIGRRAAGVVEDARSKIAQSLACLPEEVIFTSGATEANNLIIKGLLTPLWRLWRGGRAQCPPHVISTPVEHQSVLDPLRRLQRWG
ncbi:MAG: aminotransferase class V-fold PLP-dependent enzyme, partial [Planctomycetota bacterium]